MSNVSIWRGTAREANFPSLEGHVDTDVAIVGGGITGLTLAMLLAEEGKSVVLLEARSFGLGATGNSTGNLYEVVSGYLHTVGSRWDHSIMAAVAESRRQAVDLIERISSRVDEDCGFRRRALYLYATDVERVDEIDREYRALKDLAIAVRIDNDAPTPLPSLRTLVVENQAQFHPLAYLRGLARRIASGHCQLYEHSAVLAIDEHARTVHTERGMVSAREIVLATHTPKGRFLVQAEMLPNREYGIGLRLRDDAYAQGIFWGVGEYFHSIRCLHAGNDDYLIVVGEEHKTGQHEGLPAIARLEEFARQHYDVASVDFRWSAQNYRAADGLPYIGRTHSSDLYIATGFGTDGLTYGTLAASIIADQILGRENPWAEIYHANRFAPVKGAKGMLDENLNVAKALVRDYVGRPHASLQSIGPGEGAVVEIQGEKLAAYRDEAGTLSALSPVCTHLKCIVHWNAAEKTWDCPCHGSRFDINGDVIEGPALAPLERRPLEQRLERAAGISPNEM